MRSQIEFYINFMNSSTEFFEILYERYFKIFGPLKWRSNAHFPIHIFMVWYRQKLKLSLLKGHGGLHDVVLN
jgi:hypothetical protein